MANIRLPEIDQAGNFLNPAVLNQLDNRSAMFLRNTEAYYIKASDLTPGADNRSVILNAVNAAVADGVRRVVLPRGEVTLGAQVTIPATAHGLQIVGHGEDTVVRQVAGAVNTALFYGAGTDGTKYPLTADHAAGVSTVTVPDALAGTLGVGSYLGIECTTLVYGMGSAGQESRASEIRQVVGVSGTTITVDGPLLHDYTVAATAVAWKMSPLNGVSLADFVITSTDPASIKARAIALSKASNTRVTGVHLRNAGGGIYYTDVMDSYTADVHVDGLPNVANFLGYGVAVGGRSAHAMIENLRGRDFRHLFTTLADERAGGVQWGGPRHITVRGGVGEARKTGTQYSIWDTHPYGYDVVFDACRAFGGSSASSSGFQIRSKKTKILNGSALRSGSSGVRVDPVTADDVEINGGEFGFGAGGISLGKNTRVNGAWVHDNTGAGFVVSAASSGSQVRSSVVENNLYGFQDQSTGEHVGVVVQGNTIPKSAKQSLAFLSPKGNLIYTGNVAAGYGAGSDGVGGSPGASVKRINNVTD